MAAVDGGGDESAVPAAGEVEVVHLGPTTEVRVSGEIDIATNARFDAALEAAGEAGATVLEMDLSQVTFMGSTGLAALLRSQRLMRERGARLVLLRPSRAVTDLLEMTKLLDRFGIAGPAGEQQDQADEQDEQQEEQQ